MANSYDVEVNYEAAKEVLSNMYNARLDAFYIAEEMEVLKNDLDEIWEGTDAVTYTAWLTNYIGNVKNTSKWMNEVIYELNCYIERIQESEGNVSDFFEESDGSVG